MFDTSRHSTVQRFPPGATYHMLAQLAVSTAPCNSLFTLYQGSLCPQLPSPCISPALSAQNVRHGRVEPRYKPCTYVLSRVHASAVPDFQEKALSFLSPRNFTRQFWLFGHVYTEHFSRVMGSRASVLAFVGSLFVVLLALVAVSACFGFGSAFFLGAALGALAALLGFPSLSLGSLRLFCKCCWTSSALSSTRSRAMLREQ